MVDQSELIEQLNRSNHLLELASTSTTINTDSVKQLQKHIHKLQKQIDKHNDKRVSHVDNPVHSQFHLSVTPITSDDYYRYHSQFTEWLYKQYKYYFTELTSDDARHYFKKFVKRYNAGELDRRYYSNDIQSSGHTTSHQWKYMIQLSDSEKLRVANTLDSVYRDTTKVTSKPISDNPSMATSSNTNATAGSTHNSTHNNAIEHTNTHSQTYTTSITSHTASKVILEQDGKLTGHAAQFAKKRALNSDRRSAENERGDTLGTYSDSTLMGGDNRYQLQQRIKQQKVHEQAKRDEQQARLSAYQQSEHNKMIAMLASIGKSDLYEKDLTRENIETNSGPIHAASTKL